MAEHPIYLLKITEGSRVVAEARLVIHDKEWALLNFYETVAQVAQIALPGVISAMQIACSKEGAPKEMAAIAINGNHSGLQVARVLPANANGHRA